MNRVRSHMDRLPESVALLEYHTLKERLGARSRQHSVHNTSPESLPFIDDAEENLSGIGAEGKRQQCVITVKPRY